MTWENDTTSRKESWMKLWKLLLRKQSAGQILSTGSSGYFGVETARDTAFPAAPYTNQRLFRTDRGLEYYYDGTRWLSTQMFVAHLLPRDTQAFTQATHSWEVPPARYDIGGWFVERLQWTFFPAGTVQSAVNFYTLTNTTAGGGGAPTLAGTLDTKTMTVNIWNAVSNTFSANQAQTTAAVLYAITLTPTGAPGTFFFNCVLEYRLIG